MGREYGHSWSQELAAALEWWRDAGVDSFVEEAPRDWLAAPAPRVEPAPEAPPAVTEAPLPDTIEGFVAWRLSDAAPEADWHSAILGPTGPASAATMVLTDMPEPDDSNAGTLLGGAAGRLFDRILAAIGETRDSVHLVPLAYARPITGRLPPEQAEQLARLARHHAGLAKPKRLLLLGEAAKRVWPAASGSAPGNRSSDINLPAAEELTDTNVAAIRHPRFLLEHPAAKAEAWKQLIEWSGGTCP
ncbi:uracil-DNA glycosylase family protein [Sphingomonas sp.]|uniref:uracil-DNA glycosylase family protein n=1 Tax=Sphingomonas sp. TaxID=28214 RepID=UPI001B01BC2F|nr:uracil-DNA glycosylase family protein [Sphingomonas sp.]MBO9711786.1 uracil-DNA glycosylase [Sphingomonas sp.]